MLKKFVILGILGYSIYTVMYYRNNTDELKQAWERGMRAAGATEDEVTETFEDGFHPIKALHLR